ncbi:MAG: hypothetical protein SWH54_11530 [Thermodesulfobacteriota bacterium]|nr:hypothetical protein [Thermodesulfobacteriota bacterium]
MEMIYFKKTDRIAIMLAFFLMIFFACPVFGSIKESLPVNITLNTNWEINNNDLEYKGSLQFRISGKLDVNKTFSSAQQNLPAVLIPYRFSQVTASYSYQETQIDKDPPKDCPGLIAEYSGSGPIQFKPVPQFGDLIIQYLGDMMKNLKEAGISNFEGADTMVDFYRFHTAGHEIKVKGKKLNNDCEYEDHEKKEHVSIQFGFKIDKDGKMSGHKPWSARFDTGPPSFNVKTYDLPPKMNEKPYIPEKSSQGNVQYMLSWNIGKQQPPDIEIKNASFNYKGDNNDRRIVLHLKKLDTNSEIKAPEWIKDEKKEPAAFVAGQSFMVKATFQGDQETKKLEIWAEEEVLEGTGGFGGIKEKTIDVKSGEFNGEFKIKSPQKTIGKNKVCWKWKGRDKTPGKEEVVSDLGESEHTIYIVGGGPGGKILPEKFNKYVYIVRKGCEWATGTTGGKQTLNKIWSNFWNIPGPNNSTILAYSHAEKNYDTVSLLKSGRGACGAWSNFFYDMAACQGIKLEKITIHPKPPYNVFIVGQRPAQGNPSPDRGFTEHAFNAYQGKFYDPSYHFQTHKDYYVYENNTIVAYCNNKDAKTEDILKNLLNSALGGLLGNCYQQWFINEPNDNALADCLIENSDQCAPNSPRECELIECP